MDLQPVLLGTTVDLRPTVAEDWDALYAAASDPLIWEVHPEPNRWQEAAFRTYFERALESGGSLTIRDRETGDVIGASRYVYPDPVRDEIEIGFTFLVRSRWGGSCNREVKQLMLDHIHCTVGAAVFAVGRDNVRSRRAMEKIGGVLQAGRHERGNGQWLADHVFYRIARP
ncbi:GNAT family N-acetyltransferase [Sphingomonas sp. 22176]|uniref:GNAT family N-acetyltransferase n=1 Tax=Sphingomonas sp. 22176 TaxID=3453884 RepID=UPI003F82EB45